jgi:hypothetical protein
MTLEEYTEYYKKNLLLQTLKNGKTPRRSGLFMRLLDLMNSSYFYCSTVHNAKKNSGYDSVIDIYTGRPDCLQKLLSKEDSLKVLDRQLSDYQIVHTKRGTLIYFNKKNVSWARLDYDLMANKYRDHYIKNGFVYRK